MPRVAREIVLVDDGSSDGTRDQLTAFAREHGGDAPPRAGAIGCRVVFHERNRGKGAAVRTGFAAARGDVVVVQDADLEYDPGDHPRLIEPILRGEADVVYGTRFARGTGRQGYWKNYLANKFLTGLSNLTTGLKLSDMETCYKMFRRSVLGRVALEQNRFGFEPEVTAKLARLDLRFAELPIAYRGRSHEEGKKIGWRDGLKAIWCIIKYGRRFRRRARMVTLDAARSAEPAC